MKKKRQQRQYCFPIAGSTTRPSVFVKEWDRFNRALESQLPGVRVVAFDPGVTVRDVAEKNYGEVHIPTWLARRLAVKGGYVPKEVRS